jgi:hypothetical protein
MVSLLQTHEYRFSMQKSLTKLLAESDGSGSISKENDVVPPTPGNYFGYDSSTGLYTYYLGTGNLSPGIWQIKVVLDDGSTHTLKISLVN